MPGFRLLRVAAVLSAALRCIPVVAALLCVLLLAGCGAYGYHQVRRGETLYWISFQHDVDYRDVARWNKLQPPYRLHPGDLVRVVPDQASAAASNNKRPAVSSARASAPPKVATASAAGGSSAYPPPHRVIMLSPAPGQAAKTRPAAMTPSTGADPALSAKVDWRWPAQGAVVTNFVAADPVRKGIDIAGDSGAEVRAAARGRVVYSGSGLPRYGNLIIIKHNDDYLSAYAHNDQLLVAEGAAVQAGQAIARMGASGTDRVKLHFEIRRDGRPVNPLQFLPRR